MGDMHDLTQDLLRGKIGRRDFMVRALALGISLSGVEAILQSCGGGGGGGHSPPPQPELIAQRPRPEDHAESGE